MLMEENYHLMIDQVRIEFDVKKTGDTEEEFRIQLTNAIAELLRNDFSRLIQILYRLDVNEEKLKRQLKANQEVEAAEIIAEMIIERELQKLETRKKFGGQENTSEEEKW